MNFSFIFRSILKDIYPLTDRVRSEKKIDEQLKNSNTPACKKVYLECLKRYVTFLHMEESLKTSTRKYEKNLVHLMAVFQSIFYCVSVLNVLLGHVIQMPRVFDLYNGTLIYNLVGWVLKSPQCLKQDTFLPPALNFEFGQDFQRLTGKLSHLRLMAVRHKKKAKTKTATRTDTPPPVTDEPHSGSEPEFFDLENRFSGLRVS